MPRLVIHVQNGMVTLHRDNTEEWPEDLEVVKVDFDNPDWEKDVDEPHIYIESNDTINNMARSVGITATQFRATMSAEGLSDGAEMFVEVYEWTDDLEHQEYRWYPITGVAALDGGNAGVVYTDQRSRNIVQPKER